jgi:GNAT superfamily N-acetyltransferase
MRREELAFAIDLAAQEGWNPGLHDAACFLAADPGGFLVGEVSGEPVGCISAVSYAGRYGFVGLYIVRPEFRGRGHGLRLWRAALERLRGHVVGLDGVVAQQANYARSGFRLAHRSVRHEGRAAPSAVHPSVRPAAADDFGSIREFDRRIFPAPRDAFLDAWLTQREAGAFVATDGGRLAGYTVVRRCRVGWKVGPLAADDSVVARRLYDAAAAHAGAGAALFLDVPEADPAGARLVADLALSPVFECARMYLGTEPSIERSKWFGVTTFELG